MTFARGFVILRDDSESRAKRGLEWTEHLVFGSTPEWDFMTVRTSGKSVSPDRHRRRGKMLAWYREEHLEHLFKV